jgi:hypothetical protein
MSNGFEFSPVGQKKTPGVFWQRNSLSLTTGAYHAFCPTFSVELFFM